MKKYDYGIFCEVFGKSLRNLILEHILINRKLDFTIGDLAEEAEVSRPKAYKIIKELMPILKKTRRVSGTQMYTLNEDNPMSKILIESLFKCHELVVIEFQKKEKQKKKLKTTVTH